MEEAASAVASAGIMLVMNGSGNGFVPCGTDLCTGTVYADLCMTRPADFSRALARDNPELFYGFWGRYHNMVAEARLKPPHSGLDALLRWRRRLNAQKLVKTIEGELPSFFAYSQAVDGVLASAVPDGCEVHGSALYWQCADACTDKVWRLPDGHRFEIHPASLTCKARPAAEVPPPPQLLAHYNNECDSTETGANPPIDAATSHSQCPQCKGQAVPNLIELGVETCVDSAFSALNYVTWRLAVEELARGDPEDESAASPSVVVLELGCSSAVPTAREEAEEFARDVSDAGISTTLIRVNTSAGDAAVAADTIGRARAISLPMSSADALAQLSRLADSALVERQAAGAPGQAW